MLHSTLSNLSHVCHGQPEAENFLYLVFLDDSFISPRISLFFGCQDSPEVSPLIHNLFREVLQSTQTFLSKVSINAWWMASQFLEMTCVASECYFQK